MSDWYYAERYDRLREQYELAGKPVPPFGTPIEMGSTARPQDFVIEAPIENPPSVATQTEAPKQKGRSFLQKLLPSLFK